MNVSSETIGQASGLFASLIWAFALCSYRFWGSESPAHLLNLFKGLVATLFLTGTLVVMAHRPEIDTESVGYLVASGVFGITFGDTFVFAALSRLGTQRTSVGLCLGPPSAVVFGWFFLGENLTHREWAGMCLTLLGILGVLVSYRRSEKPLNRTTLLIGTFCLLTNGVCQGLSSVFGRKGLIHADVVLATWLRVVPATFLLSLTVFLPSHYPSVKALFWSRQRTLPLFITAFFGTFIGLTLMSVSLKYTKAGIATALMTTYPVWIVPISVKWLKEPFIPISLFFTLVTVGGIFLLVD